MDKVKEAIATPQQGCSDTLQLHPGKLTTRLPTCGALTLAHAGR
jgi:hypothetical protein